MFYEANSHPRRAFGNQHIQSNPEHPQYSIKCFEPECIIYIIFIFFQVFYQVFFIFPTVIHSRPVKNAKKEELPAGKVASGNSKPVTKLTTIGNLIRIIYSIDYTERRYDSYLQTGCSLLLIQEEWK